MTKIHGNSFIHSKVQSNRVRKPCLISLDPPVKTGFLSVHACFEIVCFLYLWWRKREMEPNKQYEEVLSLFRNVPRIIYSAEPHSMPSSGMASANHQWVFLARGRPCSVFLSSHYSRHSLLAGLCHRLSTCPTRPSRCWEASNVMVCCFVPQLPWAPCPGKSQLRKVAREKQTVPRSRSPHLRLTAMSPGWAHALDLTTKSWIHLEANPASPSTREAIASPVAR